MSAGVRYGASWWDAHAGRLVALIGAALGLASFGYYFSRGLITAHYDAKAHLVVARRIVDSIEPGYEQMGAHWLPLIHLLYLPLVLSEDEYRSGVLPSLISVVAFVISAYLVYAIARRVTDSSRAGFFAAVFLLANANLQYLQSCPLTEPVYMALLLLAVKSLLEWRASGENRLPWASASWTALGALCRYEGWYFFVAVLLLFGCDFTFRRAPRRTVIRGALLHIVMFAVPIVSHFAYIYARTGDSFLLRVARGNPAPFESYRRPLLSAAYHIAELCQIAGVIPLLVGVAGTVYCLARLRPRERWLPLFLLWIPSLINISALYWGLIYRVRYSVLLIPALAIFGALLVRGESALRRVFNAACLLAMTLPWLSWYFPEEWKFRYVSPGPGSLVLPLCGLLIFLFAHARQNFRWPLLALCVLGMQIPVLQGEYRPILDEALEHNYIEPERHQMIEYLTARYDGTRILLDMGRHAPLVYDSRLPIREFIYNEGDSREWHRAIQAPYRVAGWLLTEKPDEVWNLLQVDPSKLDRYSLALQTENFLLYRLKSEDRESLLPGRRSE